MWNYFKKQKIGIFSILVGLSYAFLVVNTFINEWDSMVAGFKAGWQRADYDSSTNVSKGLPLKRYYLSLEPKDIISDYPDSLVNQINNSTIHSRCEDAIVLGPSGTQARYSIWLSLFHNVFLVIIFVTYCIIPFHFYQLIGMIKKGIIFERENIRLIRCLGYELLIVYFGNVLFNYMSYKINTSLFAFKEYEIGMNSIDSIWLLFGIVVLLIAEIFSKALVLKEEQELTI